MAHRAPRQSDTGAGAGGRPREGGVTMLMGRASKTEGRRGSQRRLDEGRRYLGIPQNGGLAAPRTGSDDADAHNSGLLSVQETGCGTPERLGRQLTVSDHHEIEVALVGFEVANGERAVKIHTDKATAENGPYSR